MDDYAVVLAHKDGLTLERLLAARYATLEDAQQGADRWTRHHGHRPLDTDVCGFYAYTDRVSRPGLRIRVKRSR